MTRKLGALGLALAAVFAMSALAASSASASKFQCTNSASGSCILTGTSEAATKAEFTSGESAISCTAHFRSTGAAETERLTVIAEYTTETCEPANHVRLNHCDYEFSANTTVGAGTQAPVTINCASGSNIEMELTNICTLKFGSQTPGGGVKYTNLGGSEPTGVTVEAALTGITFTKSGPFCFLLGNTAGLKAKDTITCYEDAGTTHPAGEPTATTATTATFTEGAQRGCHWIK